MTALIEIAEIRRRRQSIWIRIGGAAAVVTAGAVAWGDSHATSTLTVSAVALSFIALYYNERQFNRLILPLTRS